MHDQAWIAKGPRTNVYFDRYLRISVVGSYGGDCFRAFSFVVLHGEHTLQKLLNCK